MASNGPNVPIVDYATPAVILDTVVLERASNKLGNYDPIEPGSPFRKASHSAEQVARLEGNEFLAQKASADDEWMAQHWGKPPSTQDIANWEASFSGEANAYPIFLRRYLEKRDGYTPRTKLTALPGLYRIEVTASGTGYTSAPTISFSGGTGSGGSAIAILNNSGGIAKVTLKSEGNWTVAPTVVFTGGGGAGATATAYVQAQTCVLVEEKTGKAPEPYDSLYILVQRLYETLPGPWLPRAIWDLLKGPVQLRQRAVANTGQVSSETANTTTTYQSRDGSAIVLWEIEETFSDGTGVVSCSAASVAVAAGGSGYVTGNTVTLTGGTFTTATVLTLSTFGLLSANVFDPGSDYVVGQTYTLTGGAGTVSAVATIATIKLVSVSADAAGGGYAPGDFITLSGGTASTKAIVVVEATKMVSATRNARGTGYVIGDTITMFGGTFSVAAITTVASVSLVSVAINAAGSGYAPGDQVVLAGGTTVFPGAASIQVQTVGGSGEITGIVMSANGGYSATATNFTQASTSGAGTGATFNTPEWGVNTVTVSTGGNYTANGTTYTQSSASGAGTGVTFSSALFGVLSVDITNAGNYTVGTATFTQFSTSGGGTGATFQSGIFGANTVTISTAGVFSTTSTTLTLGTGSGSGTGATLNSALYSALSAVATTPGTYSVTPTNPAAQGSSSGSGTGATFTVDFQCSQNSTYPQIEGPIAYDDERGDVHSHSQLERVVFEVTSATVVSGGTGGTPGAVTITGTTGTGTKFTATGTIGGGGVLAGALTVGIAGIYSVRPTNLLIEPVTGGGLSNATVALTMDATQQSSLTVTPTLATLVNYKRYDEFRLERETTFWTLPGPTIVTFDEEPESATKITTARRMKRLADITEFQGVVSTSHVTTTAERSGIGAALAFEKTVTIAEAVAHDLASAVVWDEIRPYGFTGYVNEAQIDYYGTAIASRDGFSRPVHHNIKRYWVNTPTPPTLTIDIPLGDDIVVNNVNYREVLHNAFTRSYNGHAVTIAATYPSYTTYLASWVGTERIIGGSVRDVKRFRYEVIAISVASML